MGTYCTVADVWEQIKIDDQEMSDDNVEKRITEAEIWVNGIQDNTYSGTIPDLIKYATACYTASLVLNFLFTASEPNASDHPKVLANRAREYLNTYGKSTYDPESGMEKVNSDFFDTDTG